MEIFARRKVACSGLLDLHLAYPEECIHRDPVEQWVLYYYPVDFEVIEISSC